MNEKEDQQVVKHNDLNAISYFNSAVQLKIFSKLIVEIRKNPNQKIHNLHIKDVLEEFNPNSDINKNYAYLKEVAKSMFKVIDIPKEKGFDLRALFVNINTSDKTSIQFEINPSLKPYILKLSKNFTCYFLENIVTLGSGFSIRIYELLKQYQDFKTGEGWVNMSIGDIKRFLGIDANKYKQYSHFKNRVILTAKRELEDKTDIKFTFAEDKTGKKVDRLIFQILPNKRISGTQPEFDFSGADEANKALLIKTEIKQETYGLSDPIVDKILEKITTPKDQDNLLGALRAAKNYINQNQGKCNPAAITQAAIRDGWYLKEEKSPEITKSTLVVKPQIEINNESSFWLQFSSILQTNFSNEIFSKWLSKLNFIKFDQGVLTLATTGDSGKFYRDNIKKEYQPQMLLSLQDAGVSSITITYLE